MSDIPRGPQPDRFVYNPDTDPALFDGVLSKRIVAFFIDAILIVALMIPAGLLVLVLGFVTFGFGWLLFPPSSRSSISRSPSAAPARPRPACG
jgi:uncharacterized RDD family membrane protein YckC